MHSFNELLLFLTSSTQVTNWNIFKISEMVSTLEEAHMSLSIQCRVMTSNDVYGFIQLYSNKVDIKSNRTNETTYVYYR